MTINGFPRVDSTVPDLGEACIDPVTGVLSLRAVDYGQRDLGEPFFLMRDYVSGRMTGDKANMQMLGSRWLLSFGGKLVRKGARLQLPIGDFRWEAFCLQEGRWEHAEGNRRYQLQERRDGFLLRDLHLPAEYVYDARGHLVSLQKRGGIRRCIQYYGDTPVRIVLSSGQEISLHFEDGHLSCVEDVMGRKLLYQYKDRFLWKVIYPNHSSAEYDYDDMGRLAGCRDRNGDQVFRISYDDYSRVVRYSLQSGERYVYRYLDQNFRTLVLEEESLEFRSYYWNRRNQIEKLVYEDGMEERFEYDAVGRVVYKKDRSNKETRWEYDGNGLPVREERKDGLILDYSYDELGRLARMHDNFDGEEQYRWNSNGWLIEKKTRLTGHAWRKEAWERDMVGRILSYSRNGNKTRYVYEAGSPMPHLMETSCGAKFSYRYDKVFRLRAIQSSAGERLISYNVLDLVAREEDALKNCRTYTYDFQGKELDGKEAPFFDFPGNPEKSSVMKMGNGTYKDQSGILLHHDAKGRLEEVRRADDQALLARFRYDIGGRMTEERRAWEDEKEAPGKFRLRRWKYDDNDNVIEERIWLDPQEQTSTRGRIQIRHYDYDAQDRLVHVEDNRGDQSEYSYDDLSRCILAKHRKKEMPVEVVKYLYDADGRLVGRDEKSDYARTGKLWAHTAFTLDAEGVCLKALLPDDTELEGADAGKIYKECLASLPRYGDISGYCR